MAYRLLLMDDSVTIRRVMELTFAGEDVDVTSVGDGKAAMERIASDPPDIVLADTATASPDGYEVAAFVKGNAALAHIPVLLLSGAFQPIDQDRARSARCDGVLAKPFELQSVIARVKELLQPGSGAEPQPPEKPSAADPPGPGTERDRPKPTATALTLKEYAEWLDALLTEPPTAPPMESAPERASADPADNPATNPEPLEASPDARISPAPSPACLDDYFDMVDRVLAQAGGLAEDR